MIITFHKRILNCIIYLFQLTLTYDFCLFICQGFIEKNFLYTQSVSWGKNNSCCWHWRLTIFLLQTVRYYKEDSEAYVHSLQRKKFQNKEVRVSENSFFFMLKISHQITLGDGRKEDRRNTNLSVPHFKLAQALQFALIPNSQVPPIHLWGQLALLFSSLFQTSSIPSSTLLHPDTILSPL